MVKENMNDSKNNRCNIEKNGCGRNINCETEADVLAGGNDVLMYERTMFSAGYRLIAGIDEAGRGPLCGPVVAAAVILPNEVLIPGVTDSKKLSEKKMAGLYDDIMSAALSIGVGIIDNTIIDRINILNATKAAMLAAVKNMDVYPDYLLTDALKLDTDIPFTAIVKGDLYCHSISAASIIAKVTRDGIMRRYAEIYPEYGLEKHKGYGTKAHYEAILKYGVTPIHRRSFRLFRTPSVKESGNGE